MIIKTSDTASIQPIFERLILPKKNSHKGQNGKVLIIGGSSLFHAASLWAAEVASHFCDMVHYSSTLENEKIFHELKKTFRNGIIIPQNNLDDYIKEDDAILVGPGMMREGREGEYTYDLTDRLIKKYPEKRFVFDAGALQLMEKSWLSKLKQKAIITPHQKEFEKLFGVDIENKKLEEKILLATETAKEYKTVILLKAIEDIITDGVETFVIEGGNAGLTKGGTGDILGGLSVSFYTKNTSIDSALFSSILLKRSADRIFTKQGYWYNISDIIKTLPLELRDLVIDKI